MPSFIALAVLPLTLALTAEEPTFEQKVFCANVYEVAGKAASDTRVRENYMITGMNLFMDVEEDPKFTGVDAAAKARLEKAKDMLPALAADCKKLGFED